MDDGVEVVTLHQTKFTAITQASRIAGLLKVSWRRQVMNYGSKPGRRIRRRRRRRDCRGSSSRKVGPNLLELS